MRTEVKLSESVQSIDTLFGDGYAKEHPEFLGQYLLSQAFLEIDETLASTVEAVLATIPKLL